MKYFVVFLLIAAASATSFGQQFHIVKSKVEMVSVADPPLVIIDGKIMPRLIKSKSDSTQMVSPLDEINEMEIEHISFLKGSYAVSTYGEAGKYGVMKITLKQGRQNLKN